ncbi:MAG: hypothetical protein HOP19_21350 [Acidobacteria bacterium]|nr:hypothetical protein [Acidobacteriota bacterium]
MNSLRENISDRERVEEFLYQTSLFSYELGKDTEAKRQAELRRIREQLERLAQLRQLDRRDNTIEP